MILRPYQEEALTAVKSRMDQGVMRQLLVLPTGTGKGPIFAALPKFIGCDRKMLVLVHTEELMQQAVDRLTKWNPGVKVGVEMAAEKAGDSDPLIVASVATLGRKGSERLKRFDPKQFCAIVVDECHRATAPSYQRIFEHFEVNKPGCERLLLGLTATPNRADKEPLGTIFDDIAYRMSLYDAVKSGWLVDLKAFRIECRADLSKVHTIAGDFSQDELANAVNTPRRNNTIVSQWLRLAKDRRTLVFAVDIKHAKDLAAAFNAYGIKAEAVWGDDPDRESKLAKHRAGETQVLTNCAMLTTGYDDPGIGAVVLARPTKSSLLYEQCIGRGTRLQAGIHNLHEATVPVTKPDCLTLDCADNSGRHNLVSIATLFGMGSMDYKGRSVIAARDLLTRKLEKVPNLNVESIRTVDALEAVVERVDIWSAITTPPEVAEHSALRWLPFGSEGYVLYIKGDSKVYIKQNLLDKWSVSGKVEDTSVVG